SPWRPLINVLDMARAIRWACERDSETGGAFLAVNTGSDSWNYQIKDLALATQRLLPGVEVSINKDAQPDKRSYRVDFGLFRSLAPGHQPQYGLKETVQGLITGLRSIQFKDADYHRSGLIRLNVINELLSEKEMDHKLSLQV
ncbi:MAG: NAD(P)-dependent oxidoreductase, partial [Phaeodactylibacter sp.]|nr:NAD(P)-dependent oxidoreductase [Phaeodactylibacter sp.]